MIDMRVEPGTSIGPIRLGMTHAEVQTSVAGREIKGQGSRQRIPELGLLLEYTSWNGNVAFIEASAGSGATYHEIDLFYTSADDVVAHIVQTAGLDPTDFPPARHTYLFEGLQLVLWRATVPYDKEDDEDDEDEDGHSFQTVSVYSQGYYSEEALQYLRMKPR